MLDSSSIPPSTASVKALHPILQVGKGIGNSALRFGVNYIAIRTLFATGSGLYQAGTWAASHVATGASYLYESFFPSDVCFAKIAEVAKQSPLFEQCALSDEPTILHLLSKPEGLATLLTVGPLIKDSGNWVVDHLTNDQKARQVGKFGVYILSSIATPVATASLFNLMGAENPYNISAIAYEQTKLVALFTSVMLGIQWGAQTLIKQVEKWEAEQKAQAQADLVPTQVLD